MALLDLEGVWRTYQLGDEEIVGLRDATLHIEEGEYIAISGPSGSGKSTLLQILGLIDRPSRGSMRLDGQEVAHLNDAERTRLRLTTIGFIFQRFHLLHDLTAIENVSLPMEVAGVGLAPRYARAAELLTSMGLGARLGFRPAQLSGGQRQRVAIARALANRAGFLLADEPTGELHSDDKAQVLELFDRFHRDGHTIVVVTHDPVVADVAQRRIEIRDGRIGEVP